jgi:D-amino-acid dehydrogenase
MKIGIVGAGVTGLFAAYFLRKDLHEVTVLDKEAIPREASIYNAGLITPSFAPTPTLGLGTLLASAFVAQGPLYLSPKQLLSHPEWFWISLRKGLHGFEERTLKLGKASLDLYTNFFREEAIDPDIIQGVLGVFRKLEDAKKFAKVYGLRFVEEQEVRETTGLRGMQGGVDLESELSINPGKLIERLRQRVAAMGVDLEYGKQVELKKIGQSRAQLSVDGRDCAFDIVVVCAGAWTSAICQKVGYDPKILPASGLALIYDTKGKIITQKPLLLEDYGVGVTQHDRSTLRITSFFEMVGFKKDFNASRRKWLREVVSRHLIDLDSLDVREEGIGFRPCAPDQFPVVGHVPGFDNLYVASGSCRLGVTLAPVCAYLLTSTISGTSFLEDLKTSVDPSRF